MKTLKWDTLQTRQTPARLYEAIHGEVAPPIHHLQKANFACTGSGANNLKHIRTNKLALINKFFVRQNHQGWLQVNSHHRRLAHQDVSHVRLAPV